VSAAMCVRPSLEVADIIHEHGVDFLARNGASLSPEQRRALTALANCRTAALGGHVEECDHCGHQEISYNSCRNRNCPKCQANRGALWMEREAKSLLPVEYYHVVFTLPHELAPLALQNPRVLYGLLFETVSATLREVAADSKHLGAQIGVVAVLHTWGQTLQHHPHVHCLATGGGLAVDERGQVVKPERWVSCRRGFFLDVKVLSAVYREKFLTGLRQAYAQGRLEFHGRLADLAEAAAFQALLQPLQEQPWVVYCKPPFAGPEVTLKYLARYTHRIALSNHRLVAMADGKVTFTYKDYAAGGKEKRMTLDADEFLRRYLQHVLPGKFVKVRHYGLLANSERKTKLDLCRELLAVLAVVLAVVAAWTTPATAAERQCPECSVGWMRWREDLPRGVRTARAVRGSSDDSS
jgi:hypothetical protein